MNIKPPLFIATLCMMASLNISLANTLASERMITTDDYANFLNTPEREEVETSSFLEIGGAMNRQDCYEEKMAEEAGSSCLIRMGEPGNYFYACTEGTSSLPLHFMSALDAELYCKWNNTALTPAFTQSSEIDPLVKTSTTTFQIQIAHDGTSLHQSMGEEEIVEPFISQILEEIIGVVLASGAGAIGETALHESAPVSNRFHGHQVEQVPAHSAPSSLKMSPEELKAYQREKYGRTVEPVVNNPSPSIHEAVPSFASPEKWLRNFSAYNDKSSALPLPYLVRSNLYPDLVNNSLFRNVGDTSTQERFEEAIKMIQGECLFRYNFPEGEEPVLVKEKLDGRAMLGQLVEGEIEFPLTTPSLQN